MARQGITRRNFMERSTAMAAAFAAGSAGGLGQAFIDRYVAERARFPFSHREKVPAKRADQGLKA